ncbi:MAG: hypothetical protein HY537_16820 [Deltaproteobacteria bacterium]|nr:hypothetical protein [Deltaproteobacteria bacterium]
MKALVEVILAVSDLFEAEVRLLRKSLVRRSLTAGVAIILLGSVIGAFAIFIRAIYRETVLYHGEMTGALVAAGILLVLAGGCVWTLQKLAR